MRTELFVPIALAGIISSWPSCSCSSARTWEGTDSAHRHMALVGFVLLRFDSDDQPYINIVGAVIIVVCGFIAEYDMHERRLAMELTTHCPYDDAWPLEVLILPPRSCPT